MGEVTKETCYVHVFQCRKSHPLSVNKPLLLVFTQLCRSRRRMRIMLSQALFSFLTIFTRMQQPASLAADCLSAKVKFSFISNGYTSWEIMHENSFPTKGPPPTLF